MFIFYVLFLGTAQAQEVVGRRKPGRVFFITVSLDHYVDTVRQELLDYFDSNLVSYCISVEKSIVSRNVSYHLHCFLEFSNSVYVDDLRQYIDLIFDGCKIDVQACRSKKSCVKYISKEDVYLLSNIKVSSLHFNYRCYVWAGSVSCFSYLDPFVVEHRNNYRFLRSYYDEYVFKKLNKFNGFHNISRSYVNWCMDVCVWWNKYHSYFCLKRPCLYLYGETNVGKSTFVENVVGEQNMPYVFYPGVGKFFMAGFNVNFHRVILFEEFEYKFYPVSLLKRLCEGRPAAFPVKCEPDKLIKFQGPIIFISNFNVISDEAFKSRLLFVNADVPYWEAAVGSVPKVEAEEENENVESEVFEISDEEA